MRMRFEFVVISQQRPFSSEEWSLFTYEAMRAGYAAAREAGRTLETPMPVVRVTAVPDVGMVIDYAGEVSQVFSVLSELHRTLSRHVLSIAGVLRVDVFAVHPDV
jgi:hypothetical protein